MLFKRIILGVLTMCLGFTGLAFGALFVICSIVYVLWHGLSVSIILFGMLCPLSMVLAGWALRRTISRQGRELPDYHISSVREAENRLYALSNSDSCTEDQKFVRK